MIKSHCFLIPLSTENSQKDCRIATSSKKPVATFNILISLFKVLRALENDGEYDELEVPCLLNSGDTIGQSPSTSFNPACFNLSCQNWQDNEIEEVLDGGVLEFKTELE